MELLDCVRSLNMMIIFEWFWLEMFAWMVVIAAIVYEEWGYRLMFQNLINPEVPLTVPHVAGQALRES